MKTTNTFIICITALFIAMLICGSVVKIKQPSADPLAQQIKALNGLPNDYAKELIKLLIVSYKDTIQKK